MILSVNICKAVCFKYSAVTNGHITYLHFRHGAAYSVLLAQHIAVPEFPCGIENPSAELEIVETSHPKNGEYYTYDEIAEMENCNADDVRKILTATAIIWNH